MEKIRAEVGSRIKSARIGRGISLSELARMSGVAKANLSKIEMGNANPTLETLWALANALRVRLSDLVSSDEATVVVVRAPQGSWVDADPIRYRSISWSQLPGVQLEFLQGTIQRGVHKSTPHAPGTVEHLIVTKGRWRVGPAGQEVELGPGDFIRMKGNLPHSYEGLDDDSEAILVAAYPSPTADGGAVTAEDLTAGPLRAGVTTEF